MSLQLRIKENQLLILKLEQERNRLKEELKFNQKETLGAMEEAARLARLTQEEKANNPNNSVPALLAGEHEEEVELLAIPREICILIAPHLSAKDQLVLKSLNKSIRKTLPKLPQLNLRFFKESFEQFVAGWNEETPIPINFQLNSMEVEKDPFAVLEFLDIYFGTDNLSYNNGFIVFTKYFKSLHQLLGNALEATVLGALQRPSHPKFKLLTLQISAYANCLPALRFLVSSNNPLSLTNDDRQRAIYASSRNGCTEALQFLLNLNDPRTNPSHNFNDPIQFAAAEGNDGCVELLLQDYRVNPGDNSNIAIRMACQWGHFKSFELLLQDERCDPSSCDNECIRDACLYGYIEIVKLLLADPRVDHSVQNNSCLIGAYRNGHSAIVKLLLDHMVFLADKVEEEILKKTLVEDIEENITEIGG